MKKSAFTYAVMLMRSEYRDQIDPKYAKKIESIVRKAPKNIKQLNDFDDEQITNGDDDDNDVQVSKRRSTNDDASPCPFCNFNLNIMQTNCPQCKSALPICIATGKHLSNYKDCAQCPECLFPGFKDDLIQ